jgi:hypothetical protein
MEEYTMQNKLLLLSVLLGLGLFLSLGNFVLLPNGVLAQESNESGIHPNPAIPIPTTLAATVPGNITNTKNVGRDSDVVTDDSAISTTDTLTISVFLPIVLKNSDLTTPPTGTIDVVTNRGDASWSIDGPGVNYVGVGVGSSTITGAPVGEYMIDWGGLPDCTPPPQETKTLSVGGIITFEGNYTCDDEGPRPGLWQGQGNFTGSFRVSSDRSRITNLEGSFWTLGCGTIDIPDDITPPAEIAISNNEIDVYMDDSGDFPFLDIQGTFTSETFIEGDYWWGVSAQCFGLSRINWNATWQSN